MKIEKLFPIQGEHIHGFRANREAGHVPWAVAKAAYDVYSRLYGKDQSLERLAERGGFGWSELVWLLRGGHKKDEEGQLPLPLCEPKERTA